LDKFSHVKTYYEVDNEIPDLEEGIPILDQSLEFHFESPTPIMNNFLHFTLIGGSIG